MSRLLQIYQIAEGYCYNSDSLFLWDFCMPFLRRGNRILEIGSGSGVIGLLCARDMAIQGKDIALYQVEKQREYAFLNAKNASINCLKSCVIYAPCKDLVESNSLHVIKDSAITEHTNTYNRYFDIIISNPPFYSNATLVSQRKLKEIATQDKYLPLESLLCTVKSVIKPNGKLVFCYCSFALQYIVQILRKYNFGIESLRFVYPRIDKESKLLLISAKVMQGGHSMQTHILPPLITHTGKNQLDNSEEVKGIYKKSRLHSIKVSYDSILWDSML